MRFVANAPIVKSCNHRQLLTIYFPSKMKFSRNFLLSLNNNLTELLLFANTLCNHSRLILSTRIYPPESDYMNVLVHGMSFQLFYEDKRNE